MSELRTLWGVYDLGYRRPGKPKTVFQNLTLELHPFETVALIGPNGCGKSTFLKLMAGLLPWSSATCLGQVLYRGSFFPSLEPRKKAQLIAYVGSSLQVSFPLTAWEAVTLGGFSRFRETQRAKQAAIQAAMEKAHCWDLQAARLEELSSGERQRVQLARAFFQNPKILLLDESLSQLDLSHQALLQDALQHWTAQGGSLMLVSHDLNFAAKLAQRLVFMKQGAFCFSGSTREGMTTEKLALLYPQVSHSLVLAPHPVTGVPMLWT